MAATRSWAVSAARPATITLPKDVEYKLDTNIYEKDENNLVYERIAKEGTISNIKYKIHDNYHDKNNKAYPTYYEKEQNSSYFYIITMGMRKTGGYSIFITDVKIDNDRNVEITVVEKSPAPGSTTTQAITYPACCLELNKPANKVTIKRINGQ